MMNKLTLRDKILTFFSVIVIATCFSLGIWQIFRHNYKEDLIDRLTQNRELAAVLVSDAAQVVNFVDVKAEFSRVRLEGSYLNDLEFYVYARGLAQNGRRDGFRVITPFEIGDSSVLLVDRGYVEPTKQDPASRVGGQIEGPTEIVGYVRQPVRRSFWQVIDDNEQSRVLFASDPAVMARWLGRDDVPPIVVTLDRSQKLPPDAPFPLLPPDPTKIFNNHFQYIITWLVLGFVACGMLVTLLRRRIAENSAN